MISSSLSIERGPIRGAMVSFRPSTITDLDGLVALQQQYYAEDGYPFVERAARTTWEQLLSEPSLGRVWVAEAGATLVAYAVLTFGYSLEDHGLDAVLDELFVAPSHRRRGLGREALTVLEAACRTAPVRSEKGEALWRWSSVRRHPNMRMKLSARGRRFGRKAQGELSS